MGWWESYDGTVIGDELADIVGECLDGMVQKMVVRFPEVTRDQVLQTLAFCSGYFKHFDSKMKVGKEDKILLAMPIRDRDKWAKRHRVPSDESKRVAPSTELRNVKNPFRQRKCGVEQWS